MNLELHPAASRVKPQVNGVPGLQPDKLAVALVSQLAKDVSGQIFGARGDTIELYSQPRAIMNINKEGGWTAEGIATEAFAKMKEKFFPLSRSATSPEPAAAKAG